MSLFDLIPEADAVCALEPDELGLRMLPILVRGSNHLVNFGGIQVTGFTSEFQIGGYGNRSADVERAVREAWAWLEGAALLIDHPRFRPESGVRILSRRAERLAKEDPHRAISARRLPKEALHPSIREDVWALYHRGKYDTAVLEAMKAVEVAVREAAELSPNDLGTKLMGVAFNADTGPLTDMDSPEAERKARAALFVGAIGSYKNPHSHRYVDLDDPDEATEIIMLATHLLRIVDTRRKARQGSDSPPPEAAAA